MNPAPATTWSEAPHRTGLDALQELHTATNAHPPRALWDLLHRAYPGAVTTLARTGGPLQATLHPRPEAAPADRARLHRLRPVIATEVLEDLHRALVHSPLTMAALAAGAAQPVHPTERPALAQTVSRRMLILGCDPHEVAVRRLTDAALTAVRDALRALDA